jgi:hypothetical protein
MKLVALVKATSHPDAAGVLADAAGMTLAEARMRLAPEPPALLVRLGPPEADALVATLRKAGLAVLAWDESASRVQERVTARTFTLGASALSCAPRSGPSMELPWSEVSVILKGASVQRMVAETKETRQRLSLGAAVLTGGLVVTKSVVTTAKSAKEDLEQAIFVFSKEGRAIVFPERSLDFSCLGAQMQPVRIANMTVLARLLKEKAPHAFYDERLVRLGTRALPFVMSAETQLGPGQASTARTNTQGGLEILADILRQAVEERLLP